MKTNIKAIIIDDEENSRKVLRNLLAKFCPQIQILAEAEDADKGFESINNFKPQLVFLDIQMPNGSGFSLLKRFKTLPFDVIFVTSYDKYAINAIKFSALDYLLKPVEVNDLIEAVDKAVQNTSAKKSSELQIVNLLNIAEANALERNIVVHQKNKVILLKVNTICYMEADDRYCHITANNGEKHTVTKTLKEFEEFLASNTSFVRINKNFMVNVNFIKSYSKGEPLIIETTDGKSFEVSRRKRRNVMERMKTQ
jgi:two-component system LytT family response regulator